MKAKFDPQGGMFCGVSQSYNEWAITCLDITCQYFPLKDGNWTWTYCFCYAFSGEEEKKTLTNLRQKKDVSVVSWLEIVDSSSHNSLVFVWII